MNTNHFRSAHHIAISVALALTIHILAVLAFSYITSEPDKSIRTVPVVIISPQGTITNKPTSQQSKSSPRDARISTKGSSEFFTSSNNNNNNNNKNKKAKRENTNNSNSPRLPGLNQPLRQQQSREGLTTLFSQSLENKQLDQNKQLSTKETTKLSEYQHRLIQHMLQGKLYDKFHRILNSNNTKTLNYTLNLWLLSNGAIKNASIKTSSGIEEIDKLAITAAYNASPYPKPPSADAAIRFQYEVPVQYQP